MPAKLEFNKEGMKINGEKILPVSAAFHYWRMDPKWWDDVLGELIKNAEMPMVYLQVDNEISANDTWWQDFLEGRYENIEALCGEI